MGKIVYLVWTGEYSDRGVEAVCSTQERAAAVVKMLERQRAEDPYIEEIELDAFSSAALRGLTCYNVSFDTAGQASLCKPSSLYGPTTEIVESRSGGLFMHVMARNEEHAIKVASEKRTVYLARKHGLA